MDVDSEAEDSFIFLPSPSAQDSSSQLGVDSLSAYFPSLNSSAPFWSQDRLNAITDTRNRQPDGRVFIDELLALLEIDGPSSYPPRSSSDLSILLDRILSSPQGLLRAYSTLFYICLLDNPDSPSTSTAFVHDKLLPEGFVRAVEGFYSLDSGAWRDGVAALTDPHLTPDFVAKTFEVLSVLPPADERASLVLSYWTLSGVALETEAQVGRVVDALCDKTRKMGVVKAWGMQRAWNDEEGRERLARRILGRCFGDNATSTPVPQHLLSLLSHPFTPSEDAVSTAFCLTPHALSPAHSALAADFRLAKFIAENRPLEALLFGRQLEHKGLAGGDARARLLRAVRETLTSVQRNEADLDAELAAPVPTPSTVGPPKTTSHITLPAWQPRPVLPPAPLPRSLCSLPQSPAPPPPPAPSDLPLSASPFLRRDKMLVGSSDASALGGVQKSVLRALRDAGGEMGSPLRKPVVVGSEVGTPRTPLFGEKREERRPTLKGFGSVRTPSWRKEEEEVKEGTPVPVAAPTKRFGDLQQQQQQQQQSFALRAALDPAIAATLAAAEVPPTPAVQGSKRRTLSSQAASESGDKRRAVSSEAEERPRSAVRVAGETGLPGAFPGQEEEEEEGVKLRRSKRPGSVEGRRKVEKLPVRRSSRLGTPVEEKEGGGRKTPARRRGKKVEDVEEE